VLAAGQAPGFLQALGACGLASKCALLVLAGPLPAAPRRFSPAAAACTLGFLVCVCIPGPLRVLGADAVLWSLPLCLIGGVATCYLLLALLALLPSPPGAAVCKFLQRVGGALRRPLPTGAGAVASALEAVIVSWPVAMSLAVLLGVTIALAAR
jgi:hypothetical protein